MTPAQHSLTPLFADNGLCWASSLQKGGGGPALSDEERIKIVDAAKKEKAVDPLKTLSAENPIVLKTGRPGDAAKGLGDRMRHDKKSLFFLSRISKGVDGIEEEAKEFAKVLIKDPKRGADDAVELLDAIDYVLNQRTSEKEYPNGIRDKDRNGARASYFAAHGNARDAELDEEEMFSLRIYTTSAYKDLNNPLRDNTRYYERKPVPLPMISSLADEAIRKLRAVRVRAGRGERNVVLWRGMRNTKVSDDFLQHGGTELAFMSTTTNPAVAVRYALSRHALLFKLVAPDFMALGADLQWLSAFPGEDEVLFPPLTFLKPTGRTENVDTVDRDGNSVSFTVVEVTPSF
jgi:hypothetical protein